MLKTLMATGGALAAVVALAHPATAADKPAGKDTRSACFFARDVTSYSAAGDRTVYVKVNLREVYRLDLFNPCPDIDWTWKIALVSHGSDWVCSPMDATIIVNRSPIGPQRCEVSKVTKLTPEEVAALPKKSRP